MYGILQIEIKLYISLFPGSMAHNTHFAELALHAAYIADLEL